MNRTTFVGVMGAIAVLLAVWGCSDSGPAAQANAAASEKLSQAEELYRKNCKVCHAQGINGAPIVGNKKMWGPRAEQGIDVLVEHAINGFGLMPAKGGQTHLSDAEIRMIVEYYLSQIQ